MLTTRCPLLVPTTYRALTTLGNPTGAPPPPSVIPVISDLATQPLATTKPGLQFLRLFSPRGHKLGSLGTIRYCGTGSDGILGMVPFLSGLFSIVILVLVQKFVLAQFEKRSTKMMKPEKKSGVAVSSKCTDM